MIYLSQFLNMALPKAGILIHSIPVTLATVIFLITLITVILKNKQIFQQVPNVFWWVYILFVGLVVMVTLINLPVAVPKQLAYSAVLIGSPLAILLGARVQNLGAVRRITAISMFVVGAYAVSQWLLGLDTTTIHGINLAIGDSWDKKPIFREIDQMRTLVKIPATYQNGNLAAAFYVIAIPFILQWEPFLSKDKLLRYFSLTLGMTGLILSGARSAVFPFIMVFVLIAVLYLLQYRTKGFRYLLTLFLGVFVLLGLMGAGQTSYTSTYDFIESRYINTTIEDPTASGRTTQVEEAIDRYTNTSRTFEHFLKRLLLGMEWNVHLGMEGFLLVCLDYGIIAMLLFVALLLILIFHTGYNLNVIISLGMLAGFGHFMLDCAFIQPPTLINWFFIAGLAFSRHGRANTGT